MKNLLLFLLTAMVLDGSAPLEVQGQEKKAANLTIEPHLFEAANGEKIQAESGRLRVPERHGNPRGRLIEIAFIRFKSTANNPGSPIIYLAGGPGGSGIAAARDRRFPLFMAMREFGDVIALDQRGVGESKPSLSCRETWDFPLDRPGSRESLLRIALERATSCAQYLKDRQVDLSAYNTNESADDIEALRKAPRRQKGFPLGHQLRHPSCSGDNSPAWIQDRSRHSGGSRRSGRYLQTAERRPTSTS